jgi:hypothetical protein
MREDPMDERQREVARQVRDEHVAGRCPECGDGPGSCPRWAAWVPIIVELPPGDA